MSGECSGESWRAVGKIGSSTLRQRGFVGYGTWNCRGAKVSEGVRSWYDDKKRTLGKDLGVLLPLLSNYCCPIWLVKRVVDLPCGVAITRRGQDGVGCFVPPLQVLLAGRLIVVSRIQSMIRENTAC